MRHFYLINLVSLQDIWSSFDPMRTLLSHKFGLFEGHLVIIWPFASNSVSEIWSLWRRFGHHLTLCVQFCFTNLISLKEIWSSFDPLRPILFHKLGHFEGHLVMYWLYANTSISQSWSLWRTFGHHLTLCVQFCFTNLDSLKDISSSFDPMRSLLSDNFGLFAGHLVIIWPNATLLSHKFGLFVGHLVIIWPFASNSVSEIWSLEGDLVIIWPIATNSVSQIWSLWRTFGHHLTHCDQFCFTKLVSLKDIWSSFDPLQPILFHKVGLFEGHLVIIWPYASNSVSQIWTLWRTFRHHLTLCDHFYLIILVSLKDIWSSFDPFQPILSHKFVHFERNFVIIWPFGNTSISLYWSLWRTFGHHLTLFNQFCLTNLFTFKDISSSFDPFGALLFHKIGHFEGHLVIIWPIGTNSVSQSWSLWRTFGHQLTLCEHLYLINLVSLKDIWSSFDPLQPIPFHKVGLFEGHLVIIWPFATNSVSQVCSLW